MFNVTEILTKYLLARLREDFEATFGSKHRQHLALISDTAKKSIAHIARSNALYHNVEHTIHVVLVGQVILHGKHLLEANVEPSDWLNAMIALFCHDIGYVRGICTNDNGNELATGIGSETVVVNSGSSDATLMPWHVDRAQLYIDEQFSSEKLADVEQIKQSIERTRFPIPDEPAYRHTADYPGLVRGADLIGQLSDLRYLHKLAAIFYEFEEVGFNQKTGYRRPGDLMKGYPEFYQTAVAPYTAESLTYLDQTEAGKNIVTHLQHNLECARERG